jgi:hypothetical protein
VEAANKYKYMYMVGVDGKKEGCGSKTAEDEAECGEDQRELK